MYLFISMHALFYCRHDSQWEPAWGDTEVGSWALWGPEEVEVSGLWALEPGSGLSLRALGDL